MSAASRSPQQQAPAIRPTQFENGDIGSLKNSVNLFRGDLNWQQTLVTLPGKLDDETLQVTVNVIYQSNVSQQVNKWNLDAPTGVLGLGWSIDGERISARSNGALSPASLQYVYESGGSGNPLYGTNAKWIRGSIDASLASILDAGSSATAQQIQQLDAAFAATGLTLGANLTITAGGADGWRIDDADN